MTSGRDVLVIGGGVFGLWIAHALRNEGCSVCVVDREVPGHEAAGSGGASRIIRAMYGAESIYSTWAVRSMPAWRALEQRSGARLFEPTGVLWMHRPGDAFATASADSLEAIGVAFERLGPDDLRARFPCLSVAADDRALFEPGAGALAAATALRVLTEELRQDGAEILREAIRPIRLAATTGGRLPAVCTESGQLIEAETIVVAAGAWLTKLCPDAVAGRVFVTRQDVLFFDVPQQAVEGLPVWADMPFYGFPPLAGKGLKVACDKHGPRIADMETMHRDVDPATESEVRSFLARRFPSLASAPVADRRVCQYANSSNGDFLVDRHPGLDNVWIAGCGSGHGFKHGPALGAHVAQRVLGTGNVEPRFLFAAKATEQDRTIQ